MSPILGNKTLDNLARMGYYVPLGALGDLSGFVVASP